MSDDALDKRQGEPQYQGEGLLLHGRISDLEREKAERDKDEKKYRDAQLAVNDGQFKTNQRIAFFTFLLVVCTAVTGGIAWRQASIAKRSAEASEKSANAAAEAADAAQKTLAEIQKSGSDTHELAVQAKNQADASRDIANRTENQAIATNKLAGEAKRSADISQQQQRPYLWAVAVPKKPDGEIFHYFSNQVTETPPEKQPIEIRVNIFVKNSGHSPATDVIPSIPYIGDWPAPLFRWNQIQSEYPSYPAEIKEGSIVAPDSSMTIENAGPTKTDLSRVGWAQGGKFSVFFIVGFIKYSDLWHPGEFPYETTYCYILVPAPYMLIGPAADAKDRVGNCPFGNYFK